MSILQSTEIVWAETLAEAPTISQDWKYEVTITEDTIFYFRTWHNNDFPIITSSLKPEHFFCASDGYSSSETCTKKRKIQFFFWVDKNAQVLELVINKEFGIKRKVVFYTGNVHLML